MGTTPFSEALRVRADRELKAALTEAARQDRTSVAEAARRILRAAVLKRPDDRGPPPAAPAMRARAA